MSRPIALRRLPVLLAVVLLLTLPLGSTAPAADTPAAERAAPTYAGVRERGNVLGPKDAPVRIVLFADLKCPACERFSRDVLPRVVQRLVRTGRAAVELHLVNIIDPNVGTADGERLRTTALNLARQDGLWSFARAALRGQGPEDQEWATPERLVELGNEAGVRVDVRTTSATAASRRAARRADELFRALEATGTPQVFVRRRGTRRYVSADNRASEIEQAVRRLERRRPG